MNKNNLNKSREYLINSFINCLEKDIIPWQIGWKTPEAVFNPVTKTRYKNSNRFLLELVSYIKNYDDPRWMTFKQARDKGYHIIKGEHGVPIEYWSVYNYKTKKKLTLQEYTRIVRENPEESKDFYFISNVYTVFNAKQIEGIEKYIPPVNLSRSAIAEGNYNIAKRVSDEYLKNAKLSIVESRKFSSPFYDYENDKIGMPNVEFFLNEYEYYSALFHEFMHSTAHKSRLNRTLYSLKENREEYAIEELKAEIGCTFICNELGFPPNSKQLENHESYIQFWLKSIKEKPNNLFRAIKAAEEISLYVMDKANVKKYITNHTESLENIINDIIDNPYVYKADLITKSEFDLLAKDRGFKEVSYKEMESLINNQEAIYNSLEKVYRFENQTIICLDNSSLNARVEEFTYDHALLAFMWLDEKIAIDDCYRLMNQRDLDFIEFNEVISIK
ncbi:zincin-like metallopeptidase domain-containing protein [Thomasclavelia saccharogumia]|uniref:zincin-like metallopeptidase domain-containing protein n=1 Tax=Thomasclavelia saccharogumia TaxID=341225 RepID=UPI00047B6E8E|nr:zincin-like metallopeptidase domain-containing protein [Thomasclavelia saccharogumia]